MTDEKRNIAKKIVKGDASYFLTITNMSAGFPTRQIYIFFVFRTTLKSYLYSRRFVPTVRGCADRRNGPWTNLHGAKL